MLIVQQTVDPAQTTGLAQYKKHAELFGPAEVFETAQENLGPRQLAQLAGYLRGLPPFKVRDSHGRLVVDRDWSTFTISRKRRDRLVVSLIEAGEPDRFIADKLAIGRQTVARIRGASTRKWAQNP